MKNSAEFLSTFTSRSYAKRKNKAPDLPYSVRIIEVDGTYWHSFKNRKEADERKNEAFKKEGYKVYRIDALEIKKNIESIKKKISEILSN